MKILFFGQTKIIFINITKTVIANNEKGHTYIGSDFLTSEPIMVGGRVLARMGGNQCQISFLYEEFHSSMFWGCFHHPRKN